MHIGPADGFFTDGGAHYDAGGGALGVHTTTDKRAESPIINCSGLSGITLSFDYLEFGNGNIDNGTVEYFDGAAWSFLADPGKTSCCGGACNSLRQGLWANYSVALPASANNNPNVKIGFRWINNDDGVGTDPSFAITNIVLSTAATIEQFTAEYFYSNPQIPYGNVLLPNLATISNCEYWILTQDVGSSARFVTLYFDANSCGFQAAPANLLVANYNSGLWYDRGNGGFTASTVMTAAPQSLYGPFTLGSTVPLPVELLYFDAKYNGKTVDISWATASEKNNNYFTVQRTRDGKQFEEIAKVNGAGSTSVMTSYKTIDENPNEGLSYYRLMQTDYNGQHTFSRMVAVDIENAEYGLTYLCPAPGLNEIYFQVKNMNGKLKVNVIDVVGKTVISEEFDPQDPNGIHVINSPSLKQGLYILQISNSEKVINKKFFY